MTKSFAQYACSLLIIALMGFAISQAQANPSLTIDLESGHVLSHKQADDPWHPASLTKLMTAYVTFRALASGEIELRNPVRVSRLATKQPPSKMGYGRGTVLNIENALSILIVKSANDISVALAESVGGSVNGFVNRMNREARRLGMASSRFTNPHGLHNKRQVTTARDMALLVRAIHREFSQYRNLFRTAVIRAPRKTKSGKKIQRDYYSYNLLLERYRGADGFKTGFVCASGFNFVGAATRSGRRIAAVVLGRDSQTSRAVDAAKLITEGFQMPIEAGLPIEKLPRDKTTRTSPVNMRPFVCTQKARESRYNPGAGLAVIESPWLQKRIYTEKPLQIVLGNTNGAKPRSSIALQLSKLPTPIFRPSREPIARTPSKRVAGIPTPRFRPVQ